MKEKVVVITGGSSGIGKMTALTLAKKGANVVVAARRKKLLDETVAQIEKLGGQGLAIQADVVNESAMGNVAKEAVNKFGKIDVWINNAGVYALGNFIDTPSKIALRILEVNFLGCMNGTRAVLPYFIKQNHGVLINISSILGSLGQPYAAVYAASKFAVRGFSESLRLEVEEFNIKVCTVMPGVINTPLFQHTANYTGKAIKAPHPIYDVELAADKIVDLIENPKNEIYVGSMAAILSNAHKFAPDMTVRSFASQVKNDHFENKYAERTAGNLFEPIDDAGNTEGGWK